MNEEIIGVAIAALIAIVGWIFLSTSQADVFYNPVTDQRERVALTREDQIQLGESIKPELEAEWGGVGNNQRVERIANILFQTLRQLEVQFEFPNNNPRHLSNFPYRFRVLNTEDMINALALPGGSIYITEGLHEYLVTDDMVAAVLAHEIGHVALRHSAEAYETLLKGQIALSLLDRLLGRGQDVVFDASTLLDHLLQLRFSRDRETEADMFGYMLLCMSGYDPNAMGDVFEVFQSLGSTSSPQWTLTHPLPASRISAVQSYSCRF